jgi:hypothetical protein
VGYETAEQKRRMSRQMLTEMNVAQLQVIVNDLHTHIEKLNESLVQLLMERDELHMGQDSLLVDIEDLTRYLYGPQFLKIGCDTCNYILLYFLERPKRATNLATADRAPPRQMVN